MTVGILKRIFSGSRESSNQPHKRFAFASSTILGAKSLAWQQGIGVEKEPAFKHFSAGVWTLVYEVAV